MSHDDLRRLLRRQPFQPFRINLSDGRTFDVVSPEWMLVTRNTSYIGTPGESGDGELVDWVDNIHIVSARLIDAEQIH